MRWLAALLMGVLVGFSALPAGANQPDLDLSYTLRVGEKVSLFSKWGRGALEGITGLSADPPGIVEFDIIGAPPDTIVYAICNVAGRTTVTMKATLNGKEYAVRVAITCLAETEK